MSWRQCEIWKDHTISCQGASTRPEWNLCYRVALEREEPLPDDLKLQQSVHRRQVAVPNTEERVVNKQVPSDCLNRKSLVLVYSQTVLMPEPWYLTRSRRIRTASFAQNPRQLRCQSARRTPIFQRRDTYYRLATKKNSQVRRVDQRSMPLHVLGRYISWREKHKISIPHKWLSKVVERTK